MRILFYRVIYKHDLLVIEGGDGYSGEGALSPSSLGDLEWVTSAWISVTSPRTVTWLLTNEILSSGARANAEVDVVSGLGLDAGICDPIVGTGDG